MSAFFTISILLTLWFCRNSLFGDGYFIKHLGGLEVAPYGTLPVSLDYPSSWYAFSESSSKVRREMKEELLGKGWKLVYEDDREMYFKEPHHLDEQPWACFQDLAGRTTRFTCMAGLQRNRSAIGDFAEDIFMRHTWALTGELQVAEEHYPGNWKAKDLGDRIAVDFTWKNLSDDNVEFALDDFYYGGVESIENPPFRKILSPWTRQTFRLTFPARARADRDGYSYKFGTWSAGGRTATTPGGSALVDPQMNLARGKTDHTVVFRIPIPKLPMDIRNVRVVVNYKLVLHRPEIFHLKAGDRLKLPLPSGSIKRGSWQNIYVKGEARLGENKRWRSFELVPQ